MAAGARLWTFRALTVSFPAVLFVLVEFFLGLVSYGPETAIFVPLPGVAAPDGTPYLRTNPDLALRYFSRVGRVPRPAPEVLLAEKPANGYRVFVLGASTAAGWPYPNNVMPSRLLETRLADAFPDRHVEVVCLGIAAINSFALLDIADELPDYEPDLVLIYAGHNEYYGALGAASVESFATSGRVIRVYMALLELRTVRLLRNALAALQGWRTDPDARAAYEREHPTLMSRMIAAEAPLDSPTYRAGAENFEANMDGILGTLTRAGVPVLVSDLVSNVRGMPPLEPGVEARAAFDAARELEADGSFTAAREAYELARDLDRLRFRAPSEFNAIIGRVASNHGADVVPVKARFEAASPNGLVGSELMLEHVHPNADGYRLMAEAFFDAVSDRVPPGTRPDPGAIPSAAYYAEHWPVTELDRTIGRLRAMDLMDYWPFRPPGDPGNAFSSFEPRTPAEELAWRVVRDEIGFVEAHFELADRYEGSGDPARAALERAAVEASDPLGAVVLAPVSAE
jgi:lysophospholipase L1-like esterase